MSTEKDDLSQIFLYMFLYEFHLLDEANSEVTHYRLRLSRLMIFKI